MKAKTFADLYEEAERHDDYWVAGLVHDFTESLVQRMEEQGVSRALLARRLGTSQAYVTKILRGDVNFTLATLVKLARAVGAQVRLDLEPGSRLSKTARPVARKTGRRAAKLAAATIGSPQQPAAGSSAGRSGAGLRSTRP
jgi:transcriptional regulator with XRE-family HTH domain